MDYGNKLNELDRRMTQVEQQFDDMNRTLKRIENAMTGDRQYGVVSIPDKVSKNEEDIGDLQDFKKKVTYYALGGSAVGTAAGWIVVNMVINAL